MKGLSLFSGIGGLDIAAEWAGITPVLLSEIEPYACSILRKRWEKIQNVGDITRYTDATLRELGGFPFYPCGKCPADDKESIDIIYGGFPCQDVSVAGKQRGLSGKRSRLWFEMLRVIREIRPRYVLAENVRGAVNLALDTVYANLVDEGYKVYPYVIPASAVGAPHQRERLFVLGVREDVHRRYTEAMANPGCALRQGGEFCGADGVETGNRDADKPERPSSTLWPTLTGTERSGVNPITGRGAGLSKVNGGQLNPDWVEQLMNFPEGWTDIDVDEPKPWAGWPALMGESLWRTPQSQESGIKVERLEGEPGHRMYDKDTGRLAQYGVSQQVELVKENQYPYEFPRTTTGCKHRAQRLKCLGNAVVPQQAYPFFRAVRELDVIYSSCC